MKLSKEALMMEKAYSYARRQKWMARIYVIIVLGLVGIYAILMNYAEAVSTRLAMTIGYGVMIGTFSFIYGFWQTFTYSFVEGKDGKSAHDILACVCYMPFSVENWIDWVKKKVFGKIKLYSGCVFLILAAGMFVGPCDGKKGIMNLYMPEDWLLSIIVCLEGTLLVFLSMYAGYKVMLNSVVDRELKKRVGGKRKRKHVGKANYDKNRKWIKNANDGMYAKKGGVEEKWVRRKRKIKKILFAGIILGVVFVIVPNMTQGYYDALYETETSFFVAESIVTLILWVFELLWVTWLLEPDALEALPELQDDNGRMIKPSIPTDWKIGFVVGSICITFILSMLSTAWHECFTLDGVEVHHFDTKEYTWEDVDYYTIEPKNKRMCMELYMTDGKNYRCTGSDWQVVYYSDAFGEEFEDDDWNYAIWLAKTLQDEGIPLKIESWERLEDELSVDTQKIQVEKMKDALGVTE